MHSAKIVLAPGKGRGYHSALPTAELQALAAVSGRLSDFHYTLYTVFFGLDILCLSYLVFRSRFLPRAIAILLAVACHDGPPCPLIRPGRQSHPLSH